MAAKIERETIIAEVLDIAPHAAPPVHGNRHALPWLTCFPRRDRGRGLYGPWH